MTALDGSPDLSVDPGTGDRPFPLPYHTLNLRIETPIKGDG